jgi:hypothetical protein
MRENRSVAKGTLAGLAGGLAASWVMVQFQNAWSAASKNLKRDSEAQSQQQQQQQSGDSEDATMKAADKLAHMAGRSLTKEQKKKAGPAVHYAFGTLMGGVYGAGTELIPQNGAAAAALFGTGLFVAADEVAVPALGLAQSPRDYPLSTHLYGLASHLVYGFTAEYVRRGVRRLL